MKQTIQVWEVDRKKVSIEVNFPVYRKHDLIVDEGESIIYCRWDADGIEWSVQRTEQDDRISWHISEDFRPLDNSRDSADYILGRGEYASTADEYNAAVSRASAFITSIPLWQAEF